jgi:hypothetical protein
MSEYSQFIAWAARCTDRPGYGMTPGDTVHLGLRDYNEPYPCPNGLPIDTRQPGDCEHWRRLVEKARRDIEGHAEHIAFKDTVEAAHIAWPSESVSGLIKFIERQYT